MPPRRPKPPVDSQVLLLRQLLNTWALLRRVMEPRFSRSGLSSAQWGVIRVLAIAEEQGHGDMTPSALSTQLIVRPPSITGVLDRLQRQGLIERHPSPTDGRVKLVRLTEAGRKLIDGARQQYTPQIKEMFAGLSKQQQRQFSELLDDFTDHLQTLADVEQTPAANA